MEKNYIICIDDQREVLHSVTRDLEELSSFCEIEECESAEECLDLLNEIDSEGGHIALIVTDHIMPGKNGVELLHDISNDGRFVFTKKVLITGLATHNDTIEAINESRIDHYFEKPWKKEELVTTAKKLLTEFVLEKGLVYEEYSKQLDQQVLYQRLKF